MKTKGGETQMKMQKKVILPAVALALAISVWGTASSYAQDSATTDPHNTIIQKLVQKFNLKESDVKTVFDEVHTQRHAGMEKRMEERLSQAVLDGKINETQKQAILAKHKEMETQRESKKQEMEKWAKDNGIDLQYLFGMGKGSIHRGMMH